MREAVVETLLITSRCSGGCGACPFASANTPQRFMAADAVVQRINSSEADLLVITGGEPFEHPAFEEILQALCGIPRPEDVPAFRIATGGHRPLAKLLPVLQLTPGFVGLSLGTDVLSNDCSQRDPHTAVWKKNLAQLNDAQLPYSLTLTAHASKTSLTETCAPLASASAWGAHPEFIYLRSAWPAAETALLQREISAFFPGIEIIVETL